MNTFLFQTMNARYLIIRILLLLIPYVILTFVVLNDGGSNSIGGGGYDLSGLVYGTLLFAVIFVWLFWMVIEGFTSKDQSKHKALLPLLILGFIALIAAWFIT